MHARAGQQVEIGQTRKTRVDTRLLAAGIAVPTISRPSAYILRKAIDEAIPSLKDTAAITSIAIGWVVYTASSTIYNKLLEAENAEKIKKILDCSTLE